MNRNYLTFKECFMNYDDFIKKNLLKLSLISLNNFGEIKSKSAIFYTPIIILCWLSIFNLTAQNLNITQTGQKHTFQLFDLPVSDRGLLNYYEFGDGTYLKHGLTNFDMALYNTANTSVKVVYKTYKIYDGSGPPPLRSLDHNYGTTANRTAVNTIGRTEMDDSVFELDISTPRNEIITNEENVIILSIKKPTTPNLWSGDVYLFFNRTTSKEERRSFANFFSTYTKNGQKYRTKVNVTNFVEGSTANTQDENIDKNYKSFVKFTFSNITDTNQKNIFLNLKTLGINSQIDNQTRIKGLLIAGNINEPRTLNLNVRRSHDPNQITVKPTCVNCKTLNNKLLTYTVEFQNLGDGTTNAITANVKTPNDVDLSTINNVSVETSNFQNSSYSKCSGSSTSNCWKYEIVNANELKFIFFNAQLLGSSDPAVDNFSRTTGSFTYTLRLNNNINCSETLNSQAFIKFDNNPITKTNVAKTSFPKMFGAKSKAFKFGLDYQLAKNEFGGFIGISLAPKESCRKNWYNQFELMAGYTNYNCNAVNITDCSLYSEDVNNPDNEIYELNSHNINLAIVPLHLRQDLPNNLSFGFGTEFRANIKVGEFKATDRSPVYNDSVFNFDSSLFVDVTYSLAFANVGLRYLYGFELIFGNSQVSNNFTNINRGQIYMQFLL